MGLTPGWPRRQRQAPDAPQVDDPARHNEAFTAGGAYGLVCLLGCVEALLGSFQFGWMAGPVPAAAIGWAVAIGVTCVLAGWAMRSFGAALGPAIGWVIVSFVLAMPDPGGSVIITNTAPGKWYLYGGAVSAMIGVVIAFAAWIRAQSPGERP